jgi:uncharacterized protein
MKNCIACKIIAILAGIGALNWGLVALFNINLVEKLLGDMTTPAKVVYALVGVAGLITLVTLIKPCPCMCKKTVS